MSGTRHHEVMRQQELLDAQFDDIMKAHPGKYVLFHDGEAVEYFNENGEAFRAGLSRYGLDEAFVVGHLRPRTDVVSLAWQLGVAY